jgi:hypothetical protein
VTEAVARRLALEAEADRLAVLFARIDRRARERRVGFLDAGREAVALRLVTLADWDLLREAAGEP